MEENSPTGVTELVWYVIWGTYQLLKATFYDLPTLMLSIFSKTFEIDLSVATMLLILVAICGMAYLYVRYRYLTKYSRLPEDVKRTEPTIDTFVESVPEQTKPRGSYLEEFLRAIKIFGYLDKEVFHEITKKMQTEKLDSGEILFLDDSAGFTICVEGEIQVYFRIGPEEGKATLFSKDDSSRDIVIVDGIRYQLLNNVKSGAPVSSIISILSLLTDLDKAPPLDYFSLDHKPNEGALDKSPLTLAHQPDQLPSQCAEFIGIPKERCTVSMIPKESFTRIASKYPKASTHIIEMVITKLYRVTFETANRYLDLTSDIFQTEINLNNSSDYEVPRHLKNTLMEAVSGYESDDSVRRFEGSANNIHRPRLSRSNSRRSNSKRSDSKLSQSHFSSDDERDTPPMLSRHFSLTSALTASNPGDLVSSVPLRRQRGRSPGLRDDDDPQIEDNETSFDLITSLVSGICSAIGIDKDVLAYNASTSRVNSISSSSVGSPTISSMKGTIHNVNVVPAVETRVPSTNIRTFSTTSTHSSSVAKKELSQDGTSDYNSILADLKDVIQILKITKGTAVITAGEQTPGIYFVIDGSLDVTYQRSELMVGEKDNDEQLNEQCLYTAQDNDITGYLGTLIGSKSFATVTAAEDTYVAFLNRDVFSFLFERYPRLIRGVAAKLLTVLDKRLLLTDYAMEWVHVNAGDSLFVQGDPANGVYNVLNGRFRNIRTANGKTNIIGEYGQGESLGEVEVLTMTPRITTFVAIRDSQVARIPRTLFELIAISNPSIMVKVSRIVANRVHESIASEDSRLTMIRPHIKDETLIKTFTNYKTITAMPVSSGVPVVEFGERLALALESIGKTVKVLNQGSAITSLGKYAFDRLAKLKQGGYFVDMEEKFDIVIYLVDTTFNSSWTTTCIQQGDCVLLIADATAKPDVSDYERLLVKANTSSRTELVLLHPERSVEPGSTNAWLKNRLWVHAYHHIQMQCNHSHDSSAPLHPEDDLDMPQRFSKVFSTSTFNLTKGLKSRMEEMAAKNEIFNRLTRDAFRSQKYYQPLQEHKNDFMRLARLLTGQSIGLVLGGGGARGISHIGIIKALEDHGIPVDMIGGTSIGAFVGGLYAKQYDFLPVYGRAKTFAGRMSSLWRVLLDLTIPMTSYTTGHEFNRGIWKSFGDSRIEDFWIKYYVNSTNITEYLMEVHTSGYAWRYIRASMSLASLLPPLTDNGNMLLDGGYVDNLTVQEMKRRGANIIIACDVGSPDDHTPMNYGDSLSGWWVLLNKLNPFAIHPNVPTMADIQMRLAYVVSVNALDRAKESCLYLRPPIEGYATLDFAKFDEIYKVGCDYGSKMVEELQKSEKLPSTKIEKKHTEIPQLSRRYSM